jgi:hypothetical protein
MYIHMYIHMCRGTRVEKNKGTLSVSLDASAEGTPLVVGDSVSFGPSVSARVGHLHLSDLSSEQTTTIDIVGERESGWARSVRVGRLVWWRATLLLAVYFFEYVVSAGCASSAERRGFLADPHTPYLVRHSYALLGFMYQFGVLISRSSLSLVRIRRIEVLAVLQGLNMILWIYQDWYKFMPIGVQFAAMFYVGLLGGAVYVNVFALLVDDPTIPDIDRELAVNLTALSINIGIMLASLFIIYMDHTFLAGY